MAHDALQAYRADVADSKDALLVCDTTEMADALNRRVHDHTISNQAPTVTAARGHRIAQGDVIVSRRNEPAIAVYDVADIDTPADPVRNGQRWQVLAVDPERPRIAARRLDEGARTVFSGDYLHAHVTRGFAVTVHAAQGVAPEATHAVFGEHASRNLLYVALTRGRDTNTPTSTIGWLVKANTNTPKSPSRVCTWPAAAPAVRSANLCAPSSAIVTIRPAPATTSPPRLQTATNCPSGCTLCSPGIRTRCAADGHAYRRGIDAAHDEVLERQRWIDQYRSHDRARDRGIDYGLEL